MRLYEIIQIDLIQWMHWNYRKDSPVSLIHPSLTNRCHGYIWVWLSVIFDTSKSDSAVSKIHLSLTKLGHWYIKSNSVVELIHLNLTQRCHWYIWVWPSGVTNTSESDSAMSLISVCVNQQCHWYIWIGLLIHLGLISGVTDTTESDLLALSTHLSLTQRCHWYISFSLSCVTDTSESDTVVSLIHLNLIRGANYTSEYDSAVSLTHLAHLEVSSMNRSQTQLRHWHVWIWLSSIIDESGSAQQCHWYIRIWLSGVDGASVFYSAVSKFSSDNDIASLTSRFHEQKWSSMAIPWQIPISLPPPKRGKGKFSEFR